MSKVTKLIRNPRQFIKDSKLMNLYLNEAYKDLFDINNEVWDDSKKLAICIGFSPWKRDYFQEYFSNYKFAFVRGKTSSNRVLSALKNINEEYKVFIWSYQEKKVVYTFLKNKNITIHRVEDGFIRSIGLGSNHTRPLSLIIDDDSIYFNPNIESSLEKIIFKNHEKYTDKQIEESKKLIKEIINNKISKYNFFAKNTPATNEFINDFISSNKKTILVIGQVEGDMSIKLGFDGKIDNLKLVQLAYEENPNCNIIFKAHPDIFHAHRINQTTIEDYKEYSYIAPVDIGLHDLIDISEHIYTITSLSGFEALIKGKKVTCLGAPFYSNWGLTDDRQKVTRRQNFKLSVEELFYSSYVEYPLFKLNSLDLTIEYINTALRMNFIAYVDNMEFEKATAIIKDILYRKEYIDIRDNLQILTMIEYLLLKQLEYGKKPLIEELLNLMIKDISADEDQLLIKLFNLAYNGRYYDYIYANLSLFLSISYSRQSRYLKILNSRPKRPDTNYSKRYSLINDIKSSINNSNNYYYKINEVKTKGYLLQKLLIYIYEKSPSKILITYKSLEPYGHNEALDVLLDYIYTNSNLTRDTIIMYLENFKGNKKSEAYQYTLAKYYIYYRKFDLAKTVLFSVNNKIAKYRLLETVYLQTYEYENAISNYNDILNLIDSRNIQAINKEKEKIQRCKFLMDSSSLLRSVAQPLFPSGLLIYTNYAELEAIAMSIPIAIEARKLGFATISLTSGIISVDDTAIPQINKLHGLISLNRENIIGEKIFYNELKLRNNWNINWNKKDISVDGINYYQGIYEQLSMQFRRASIDINDYSTSQMFIKYLKDCDVAHTVCLEIEKIAKEIKIPIRFISSTAHGAPYSIYRRFAAVRGYEFDIHFMAINISYETYYSNIAEKTASSIAFEDVTYYHDTNRQPLLATKEKFLRWFNVNKDNNEILNIINNQLVVNRVKNKNISDNNYLEIIDKYKNSGKMVYCLFGKVLADLAVPYDGGNAHENMVDFIKHTIEVFTTQNHDDLLIIKPHPHEERSEIARDLTERMKDFVPNSLPKNIIYLESSAFSLSDLVDKIDVGLLWNGTSAIELGARNKKVIMCSHFGKLDYPIKFNYPNSRKNYEKMLTGKNELIIQKDIVLKSKMLLYYMSTDEIAIPFHYSNRRSTNDPVGGVYWKKEEIDKYLNKGDEYMKLCATKLLKKYPQENPNI